MSQTSHTHRADRLILEVGLNHHGDLSRAIGYAEAFAAIGARVIKYQCRLSWNDPVPDWRSHRRPPGFECSSRYDYYRACAFDRGQWETLAVKVKATGAKFACSVFAREALRVVGDLVDLLKIPHVCAGSPDLAEAALACAEKRGIPLVVSFESGRYKDHLPHWRGVIPLIVGDYTWGHSSRGNEDAELSMLKLVGGISSHSGSEHVVREAMRLSAWCEAHVVLPGDEHVLDAAHALTFDQVRGVLAYAERCDKVDAT